MLQSVFDLPTSLDQLESINNGMQGYKYLQKAPLRSITDTNDSRKFNDGVITYRFDAASSVYWLPSKIFFRLRCSLTKNDGITPLETLDGIGGSMGLVGNLFNEASFTINDQQISVCNRHIGEIEAIYTRLNQSGQWMRDTGQQVNFWEADVNKRIQTVSSDGQLSKVVGEKNVEIKSRLDLNVQATVTVGVVAATHVMTFAGVGSAGTSQNFKAGDIIVLSVPADLGFMRAFYVVNIIDGLTMNVATFGTNLGANIVANAGLNNFWRYRYGPANVIDYVRIDPLTTQVAANGLNLLTANAGTFLGLNPGDVGALALNGALRYDAQIITGNLTNTTVNGSSFNVSTVIAAGAANPYPILRYKNIDIFNLENAGYVQSSVVGTGHAVNIAINAPNNALLTITALSNTIPVPDVRTHFKVGDIVVVKLNNPVVRTFQALVVTVDPSNNGRSLSVIGEQALGVATGLATDGRNFMFQRIRLNGAGENRLSNVARQVKEFTLIWRPSCLSICRNNKPLVGGAKFEFLLTPKNLYREAAIESLVPKTARVSATVGDYNFQVKNMFLYVPMFEGKPHIDKFEFYIDLNEIRAQKADITSAETSYSLDVRPSTNAIAIAVQSSQVDNVTHFSSSKFLGNFDIHKRVISLHVRYDGDQKPIPSFDMSFDKSSNKDFWTEIYGRNILNTGGYFESQETMDEFLNHRGPFIYSLWPKSADSRETRIYVTVGFDNTNNDILTITQKLIVFNFYKKYAICRLDNGRWQEILLNEA